MRIVHQRSGGLAYLPGLQQPVVIDGETLDAATCARLHQLVDAAGFFDLPARLGPVPAGAADLQAETLTIERDGRRHSVQIAAAPAEGPLLDLLRAVRAQAKAGRPTPG